MSEKQYASIMGIEVDYEWLSGFLTTDGTINFPLLEKLGHLEVFRAINKAKYGSTKP